MSTILNIKVTPNSGRQQFKLDKSGKLKCFLKSAAEKGKANNELIKLISKKLGMQKSDIVILAGATARQKKLKISTNMTLDEIFKKLGLEIQLKI